MGVARKRNRIGPDPEVAGVDAEVSVAAYGASIAALLALAAVMLLWGCGNDRLKKNDGVAAIDPGQVDFGLVRVGDRARVEIQLENRGDAPLAILGIEPEGQLPPEFVVPDLSATVVPIGGEHPLAFEFAPSDEGIRTGRVIVHTDSVELPTLPVELGGEGRRPVVAVSERLDFGRVVLNTEKVLRITALNTGVVPARVEVVGVDGVDYQLFTVGQNLSGNTVDLAPRGSQLIEVRFVASHLGVAEAVAHLRVEGALEPDLQVALSGEGFASDLVAYPSCLDFGAVSPNTPSAPHTVTVVNGGDAAVAFQTPTLVDASHVFELVATRVQGAPAELTRLDPGEVAELDLVFTPSGTGDFDGELQLRTSDPINPRISICLGGRGGGANISVSPAAVNFGELAPGMAVTVPVMVENTGTSDGGPLVVTGISWEGADQGAFFSPVIAAPFDLVAGGAAYRLEITFRPVEVGTFEATLYVESNDGDTPRFPIRLAGTARDLPACDYVAEPPVLHFGQLPLGAEATLAVALRNVGEDACIFSSVALARGASSAFSLPNGGVASATVAPGEALVVPVRALVTAPRDLSTNLTFFVSDPAAPQGAVPITAGGYDDCLVAQPGAQDYGVVRISCPAQPRTFKLVNQCGEPVDIASVVLGAGLYSPGEFALTATAPITLAAGGQTQITVTYDPVDEGVDASPILVETSVLVDPITLTVSGSGSLSDLRTDVFTQNSRAPVDVLFVLDNSGSMMEEQEAIGSAFSNFIQYAIAQGLDYRIGVTTTGIGPSGGGWAACPGGVDGGEAGRLFPVDHSRPRWIESNTPNAAAIFAANVQVGVCHWWEEGLEAAYLALSSPLVDSADDPTTSWSDDGNLGFYRPNARLSVIVVTDEDDHSERPASFYSGFFTSLKGPGNAYEVTVSGVLGDGCATASGDGARYKEVIAATGGVVEPICTTDWGESLAALAEASFGFTLRFPLSGQPQGSIEVTVDGQPRNTGWRYDSTGNAVVFADTAAPAPGARIEITYVPACGT